MVHIRTLLIAVFLVFSPMLINAQSAALQDESTQAPKIHFIQKWLRWLTSKNEPVRHYSLIEEDPELQQLKEEPSSRAQKQFTNQGRFSRIDLNDAKIRYSTRDSMKCFGLTYLDHLSKSPDIIIEPTAFDTLTPKERTEQYELIRKYERKIHTRQTAPLYIQWINKTFGYGAFAQESIEKGSLIGEYTGIIEPKPTDTNNQFHFSLPGNFIDASTQKPIACIIDASQAGNFTRFINHDSQHNNVQALAILLPQEAYSMNKKMNRYPSHGHYHIIYVASKKIKRNEQLLINYDAEYWDDLGHKSLDLPKITK